MQRKQEIEEYIKIENNKQFSDQLIQGLNATIEENPELQKDNRADILIDYHKKTDKMERFIGRTHIIMGPKGVGKQAFVHHALLKQGHTKIITIDCYFDPRPQDIVNTMVNKLSNYVHSVQKIDTSIVLDDQLQFKGLDNHLKSSHFLFLFVLKNADKLVVNKRQIILYNFFEWIKSWENEKKIGLVLITCDLDFMNKLEKRVRSRLNHSIVNLMPRHGQIESPKNMIIQRLRAVGKSKSNKQAVNKIIEAIKNNKKLDELLTQSAKSPCRRPQFYLELFKLIFALQFHSLNANKIAQMTLTEIQKMLVDGFIKAHRHMPTIIDKTAENLRNMNYPEYLVMGIVRKLIIENRTSLRFKEILSEFAQVRVELGSGSSFNYPDQVLERAVKKLIKMRVLAIDKDSRQNDFKNAQIWSQLSTESIHEVLSSIQNCPQIVKKIIN